MNVDVIIEDPRWQAAGLEALAERAVSATLAHLGLAPDCEVVVLGCDDARIAELNGAFRGGGGPTNVLSWPSAERGSAVPGEVPDLRHLSPELGDIALAYETVRREAAQAEIRLEAHVLHLIVHGTLHLLGYDHVDDADGDLMESVETAILATLGVADPYSSGAVATETDGKD